MTQLLCSGVASVNPHQPVKITWKLQNGLTREVLNSTTAIHPPNTRWPDLYFDLKPMVLLAFTVVACELLVVACGIWFPDQGLNLGPLNWECGVIATGPPAALGLDG
ncbi:hypothetical protein ABFV05_005342 [Capra hircus]